MLFALSPTEKYHVGHMIREKRKLIPMIGLNATDCYDGFDAFADTVSEKKFQFSNFVSWHFTSGQIVPGDEKLYPLCRVSIYHANDLKLNRYLAIVWKFMGYRR